MTELTSSVAALAGTPDGDPAVEVYLRVIVELVPAVVGPVNSASITVERDGRFVTLVTSDELAAAMDAAQYTQGSGPCLNARAGAPVALPQITAAVQWPQFRERAQALGLYASLSIPLFAGSGAVVASLNLYSREPDAMMGLITQVVELYVHEVPPYPRADPARLHDGGEDLVDGLGAALAVHDDIQHALGMLIGARHLSPAGAYSALQHLASTQGCALHEAATDLLECREA